MHYRQRRALRYKEAAELNITAFMNLMVVLVPFLLITAVFSRITILQLNFPVNDNGDSSAPPQLALEVIVRQQSITVADRQQGTISQVELNSEKQALKNLSLMLQKIKSHYPEKLDATILMEADVSYEQLISVMDTVRAAEQLRDGKKVMLELFPQISIGDAAPASGGQR